MIHPTPFGHDLVLLRPNGQRLRYEVCESTEATLRQLDEDYYLNGRLSDQEVQKLRAGLDVVRAMQTAKPQRKPRSFASRAARWFLRWLTGRKIRVVEREREFGGSGK